MKTLISIFAFFLVLTSCVSTRVVSPRFIPITKIKAEYGLTEKQCKEVYKWAYLDSFPSYYNCGTDQRLFDPNFDYSIFAK